MTTKKEIDAEKLLDEVLGDREMRVSYFQHNFEAFFQYYFGWDGLTGWHRAWLQKFEGEKDLLFITLRASRKTTIARAYCVWCIAYAKEPYIVVQSYEQSASASWVRSVAKMLMEPSIVEDYGNLFPFSIRREEMMKASFNNFDSTTGVKIESRSLVQNLRGANEYEIGAHAKRPTLLILDDIDIDTSTRNTDIINANFDKLRTETIGAMDPLRRRIIFLGNVIHVDGIVPRFEKEYAGSKNWDITRLFLYDGPGGTNIWPEVFTREVIEKLLEDGTTAFNANYKGLPMVSGSSIIKRDQIKHIDIVPAGVTVVGGIDPAFSTKTGTDAMTIVITAHLRVPGETYTNKYILYQYEAFGDAKNEVSFVKMAEDAYKRFKVSRWRIESNNGGEIIGRMLKAKNMATDIISSSKDKETRLREHQGSFELGKVYFLPGTEPLERQLIDFPNVKNDDLVDAMVNSFTPVSTFVT